jgi:hypothetical protein
LPSTCDLTIEQAQRKFTRIYKADGVAERILRHQKDEVYGSMCRFFDTTERRCTIYTARPAVCRQYPNGARCGYYEFIQFERKHQDDPGLHAAPPETIMPLPFPPTFGTPLSPCAIRVMLLGSGELGKEVIIALQRLGVEVIAVDRYAECAWPSGRPSITRDRHDRRGRNCAP